MIYKNMESLNEPVPKTVEQLLDEHVQQMADWQTEAELMSFRGTKGHDVYNITAPFEYQDRLVIAGRVEERTDEVSSMTHFFGYDSSEHEWVLDETLPSLKLQDPFVSKIHEQWIVGGVKVYSYPDRPNEVESWETEIYAGDDLRNLQLLAVGPRGMKDIRLLELSSGDIALFTRPQGEKGGLGKAGYTKVSRLEDINAQILADAPIIPGLFADEHREWGGVAEAEELPDKRIGASGHVARYVKDAQTNRVLREYYPMTFVIDPKTLSVSNEQIIAQRDYFPETFSKKIDTANVLFSGGIKRLGEFVTWYGGVSDTSAGNISGIPNMFK